MTAAILSAVLVISALAVLLIAMVAADRAASVREQRLRAEREVRRAERRLHTLAGEAFSEMLRAARHAGNGR